MSLGNDPAELARRTEPEQHRCFVCGERELMDCMESIDISGEDDYYPVIRYVCPVHAAEMQREKNGGPDQ